MDRKKMKSDQNRPEFYAMLEGIHNGYFDCIVIYSFDCFARTYEETTYYVLHQFAELLHLRIISVMDNYDSSTSEVVPGHYRKLGSILERMSSIQLSRSLSRNIDRGNSGLLYNSRHTPYGYICDRSISRFYQIDEEAADTVRFIFDSYIKGTSVQHICRILTERQVPTPSMQRVQNGMNAKVPPSTKWNTSTVYGILGNHAYYGCLATRNNRRRMYLQNERSGNHEVPEYTYEEDHHDAIICKDIFAQAQLLIQAEKAVKETKRMYKATVSIAPYRSLVFCGCCGQTMYFTSRNQNSKHPYTLYTCRNFRNEGNNCEEPMRAHLDDINRIVMEVLSKERQLAQQLIYDITHQNDSDYMKANEEKMTRIISDKLQVVVAISRQLDEISSEESKTELEGKRAIAQEELNTALAYKKEYYKQLRPTNRWLKTFAKMPENPILNSKNAARYIERITVHSSDNIEVTLKYQSVKDTLLQYYNLVPANSMDSGLIL